MFSSTGFQFFIVFSTLFLSNFFYKKEIHRGLTGDIIEDLSMAVGLRYQNFYQKEWTELCDEIIDEKKSLSTQAMAEMIPVFDRNFDLYLNGIIGIQKFREEVGIFGRKWFFKATELSRALNQLTSDLKITEQIAGHASTIRFSDRVKSYVGAKKYKEFITAISMLMLSTKKINNYFGKRIIDCENPTKFPDENKTISSVFRYKILFFTLQTGIDLPEYCNKNYIENKSLFLKGIEEFYKTLIIDFHTYGYINSSHLLSESRWLIFKHFVLMLLFQTLHNSIQFQYDKIDDDDPLELILELLCSSPVMIMESDLGAIDSSDTANNFFLTKDILDFYIENVSTESPVYSQDWFKKLYILRNLFPDLKPVIYRYSKQKSPLKSK